MSAVLWRCLLLSKLAVVGRFGPNLAQIWPNLVHQKACKGRHYVSGALGGAHDSQKHAQTQNLESLKSKIAEIFLLYFRPSQRAILQNISGNMPFNSRQTLRLAIPSWENNRFWWDFFLLPMAEDRSTSTCCGQLTVSISSWKTKWETTDRRQMLNVFRGWLQICVA